MMASPQADPPRHLLLVEDNENDVELARAALDMSGVNCQVTVARDGREALDIISSIRAGRGGSLPDLVLLDLNMPRVGGREVLQTIKGDRQLRHIPVVIFTTSDERADRETCAALGANDYLLKPKGFDAFLNAVRRLGRRWLQGNPGGGAVGAQS